MGCLRCWGDRGLVAGALPMMVLWEASEVYVPQLLMPDLLFVKNTIVMCSGFFRFVIFMFSLISTVTY